MADLATLGIVVDASGAQRQIKLTTAELKALANGGKEAQAVMRNLTPPAVVQQMERTTQAVKAGTAAQTANVQAVQRAGASINGLREPLTSLTRTLLGLNPAVAQFSSVLGAFAIGAAPMIAILAGVAALGLAWNKLTEDSRKAKEEFEKQLEVLRAIKREQDLGITGEAGDAVKGGRKRLAVLGASVNANQRLIDGGQLQGQSLGFAISARDAAVKEYTSLALLVQAGQKKVSAIIADDAAERARKVEEALNKEKSAWTKFFGDLTDLKKKQREYDDLLAEKNTIDLPALRTRAGGASFGADLGEGTRLGGGDAGRISAEVIASAAQVGNHAAATIAMATRLGVVLAQITKDQQQQLQRSALKGMGLDAGLSLLSTFGGSKGGILAGGIGSAVSGFAAGGPLGALIGGGTALITSIFGHKKKVDDSEKAFERLAKTTERVNAALTNLPAGFKIDPARFRATRLDTPGEIEKPKDGDTIKPGGETGSGFSVNINGGITVLANSPAEFAREMGRVGAIARARGMSTMEFA